MDDTKYQKVITTTRILDTMSDGGESTGFSRSQPDLSETTRKFVTKGTKDDSTKYRPSAFASEMTTTTTTKKSTKPPIDNAVSIIRINELKIKEKTIFVCIFIYVGR